MKKIPVYGSKKPALIDDDDFELVAQFAWFLKDDHAYALINGTPVEMGYLILHPEIAVLPGNN
jgi:hypothetical protein